MVKPWTSKMQISKVRIGIASTIIYCTPKWTLQSGMFADFTGINPSQEKCRWFSTWCDLPELGFRPDEASMPIFFPIILGQRYIKQKAQWSPRTSKTVKLWRGQRPETVLANHHLPSFTCQLLTATDGYSNFTNMLRIKNQLLKNFN